MPPPSSSSTASLQVLENPFPIPEFQTVSAQKSHENQMIGVGFRTHEDIGIVEVTRVNPDSPFRGSALKAGQQLVAINGVPIKTANQAVEIIQSAPCGLKFNVVDKIRAPFTKNVAAPVWKHHPGVVFQSTRGRTLVQVSRVFPKGPFSDTELEEGDIVLAVNGFPVSKPEQADRALELYRNQPIAFVYALSIRDFRQSVIKEAILTDRLRFAHVSLKELEDDRHYIYVDGPEKKKGPTCTCVFDRETHELCDPESFTRLVAQADTSKLSFQNPSLFFKGKYANVVRPFFKEYNYIMDRRIRGLEDVVCCEAWMHPIPSCTAIAAPVAAPSRRTTTGSAEEVQEIVSASSSEELDTANAGVQSLHDNIPLAQARLLSMRGTAYAS